MGAGDVITIEAGCRHTVTADTELKLIEAQLGKEIRVHDKQKFPSSDGCVPRRPFLLAPAGKDYLWGGNRLNDDFSKGLDMTPLAETWNARRNRAG